MYIFIALILIHVLFFLSIFEIYFKSPIIENIPLSEKAQGIQLAKRVVIFYADGVRAEKFYEVLNGNSYSPYLRNLLETHQACGGIAHTRVPTETRPGAIAMLAGFYEDPSAIFKGWQDNPVEFDHIFNQSEFSVAFGSPDVLKMFARGFKQTRQKRFHFEFYDENEQEFKNETQLNYWVGNKTLRYLTSGQDSGSLIQDKVIYMLHFLGPDTAGHNYKPNSRVSRRWLRS
uniref:GPI ethanolamine phosphate transferase 1 n=1 Tax=Cacopsylla melanoneura TaxID=428564 RepID=A0A8D8YVA9_9HEMI